MSYSYRKRKLYYCRKCRTHGVNRSHVENLRCERARRARAARAAVRAGLLACAVILAFALWPLADLLGWRP